MQGQDLHMRKLVTIVTEALIETPLTRDLERVGAKGYTITKARGKGHRGTRSAGWNAGRNIRVEVICDEATALAIAEYLQEHYYDNYAMILTLGDVQVLRPRKF